MSRTRHTLPTDGSQGNEHMPLACQHPVIQDAQTAFIEQVTRDLCQMVENFQYMKNLRRIEHHRD
jgi:hypothetical protein